MSDQSDCHLYPLCTEAAIMESMNTSEADSNMSTSASGHSHPRPISPSTRSITLPGYRTIMFVPRHPNVPLLDDLILVKNEIIEPYLAKSTVPATSAHSEEQTAASNSHQQVESDQLSSRVIIETVQYEDYIQHEHAHDETTLSNQTSFQTSDTPDIENYSNSLDHNIRGLQLNVNNEEGSNVQKGEDETNDNLETIESEEEYEEECDCYECVDGIEIDDDDEECDCDQCLYGIEMEEEDGECFCDQCVNVELVHQL